MEIDAARGDLIRHRLKTGKEDPAHWNRLEGLVSQLTVKQDSKSGLMEFI